MQATAQDPDTARLMGIDTNKMIVLAFAIGAALAAVAALCYGLKEGSVNFDIGALYGLKAFTAAVLGGIGNVYGAMLGGVLLGIVEAADRPLHARATTSAVPPGATCGRSCCSSWCCSSDPRVCWANESRTGRERHD